MFGGYFSALLLVLQKKRLKQTSIDAQTETLPDTSTFVKLGYVVTLITYTDALPTRTAIIAPFIISLYKSITHHRAITSDF